MTHFEKKSLANKLFLCRLIFETVMEHGDDVHEHINKLWTLVLAVWHGRDEKTESDRREKRGLRSGAENTCSAEGGVESD